MFVIERQRPGATDFERLWLGLIALAAAGAALWLHFNLPTPACLFHKLTGIPCLTCGGTRCLRNLLAGHVAEAFAWNPLVFFTAAAVAAYAVYALAAVLLRLPRIRLGSLTRAEQNFLRILVAAALAANWIYLIRHFARLA